MSAIIVLEIRNLSLDFYLIVILSNVFALIKVSCLVNIF